MHSLRTRIALIAVFVIVVAVVVVSCLSVVFIRNNERLESDQLLLLLCETGEHNLNYYFDSVQKSVAKVSKFAEDDLEGLETEQLQHHVSHMEEYFEQVAYKTNGVLTYYYRIDPAVSDTVKGFWYTDLDGTGFVEREVTDITQYDTSDTSQLVWFTVPKNTGKPVWLPPYITDNLGARVISYNIPIYCKGKFIGVAGIEIDYTTMAEQVESIRLYSNGYAFLNDERGNLFFHPRIDVAELTPETMPVAPEGLVSNDTFVHYTYDGVEKQAAWLELCNGMRLTVSVPISETDGDWQRLIWQIVIASIIVLLVLSGFTLFYTGRIIKPLEDLTRAAEQVDKGDYNFVLNYDGDDEVGRLTHSFKQLVGHVKDHIDDLNKRVYIDALTAVKNKGAYDDYIQRLQNQIDHEGQSGLVEFAIGMYDCDGLKAINDRYGHEKGDEYLRSASHLICRVFQHSPVFRVGGDEFAVILQNDDFMNRDRLAEEFERRQGEVSAAANNAWEEVHVAQGIAVYDSRTDRFVSDTERRADKAMYANKRARKGVS